MRKKRGVRDEARIVQPKLIPGGALLAQHVARVVVTYMKKEWEPIKAKIQVQKSLLTEEGKQKDVARHCVDCGFLMNRDDLQSCQGCWAYGCRSCWGDNTWCKRHGTQCLGSPDCGMRVRPNDTLEAAEQCGCCEKPICVEHARFCGKCGKRLCLKPSAECDGEHRCKYDYKETAPQ